MTLCTNFDYNETYYKVVNENENHKGYQYKNGLNILNKEFDDSDESYSLDGLYFTTKEKLPLFFDYGNHIRQVKIPQDAKVVQDKNKFRCDKMILGKIISFDEYFDKLWDPKRFDWEDDSWALVEHCGEHFDKWWDPDKFYWREDNLWYLMKYYSNYFDTWWNSNKFNWREDSWALAQYSSNYFDKWWDSNKFNWKNSSWALAQYCNRYFDKWWDTDKFDWEDSSWILAQYCNRYFHKWWDPDKFNWENGSLYIIEYCSNHFDTWWDPNKFNWTCIDYLEKYCQDFKHIWQKDYDKYSQEK